SDEARMYALGLYCNNATFDVLNVTRIEGTVLDTRAATEAKVSRTPYSVQPAGQAALANWIPRLAAYLAQTTPPRGLEGLDHEQLALAALRSILDCIHRGWTSGRHKKWKRVKNPVAIFCAELGRVVRNEMEFAGLGEAGLKYVKAGKTPKVRDIRLG